MQPKLLPIATAKSDSFVCSVIGRIIAGLSYVSVIVTPAAYPRLIEFLHFDIQSTGHWLAVTAQA